jgi:hypothetical protein
MPPLKQSEANRNVETVMPEFESPRHGYRHTVDSALFSLLALGVDPDQITMRRAGRGWTERRIVAQHPPSQAPVGSRDIVLDVAGEGLFQRLPTGFRDQGTETEPGVDVLLHAFDDPSEKASCYVRQGGLYFDLRPDNPVGCSRWIRAFGIAPEDWPAETWYPLARFLPLLHRIAGRETGILLGLKVLLDLNIRQIEWSWQRTALAGEALTQIGQTSTRLGVDFIVGRTVEDEAVLKLVLGPVTLAQYRRHQTEDSKRLLGLVFDLVLPCHLVRAVQWTVGNPDLTPRLATEEDNAVLGINMHLGKRSGKTAAKGLQLQ